MGSILLIARGEQGVCVYVCVEMCVLGSIHDDRIKHRQTVISIDPLIHQTMICVRSASLVRYLPITYRPTEVNTDCVNRGGILRKNLALHSHFETQNMRERGRLSLPRPHVPIPLL